MRARSTGSSPKVLAGLPGWRPHWWPCSPTPSCRSGSTARSGRTRPARPPSTWVYTSRGGYGRWAVITGLGLLRVDITGRVLGVLLTAEVAVILAETVSGLAHPAGGHLSLATLSPAALGSAGFGTFGVLAVVAVLGFVGFEQAPVLGEEARHPRSTIPAATYTALAVIAVVYAAAAWAMAAHAGTTRVAATAAAQGPGLLFGLGGGSLGQ